MVVHPRVDDLAVYPASIAPNEKAGAYREIVVPSEIEPFRVVNWELSPLKMERFYKFGDLVAALAKSRELSKWDQFPKRSAVVGADLGRSQEDVSRLIEDLASFVEVVAHGK